MKKLKKNKLLLITALLIVTAAIIWIATAPNRNKTKAFLNRYEITDLTALGFKYVVAINDKGQVLGRDKQDRICIWDEQNGLTALNIPKEADCDPETLNNSGQVAGTFQTTNSQSHAFIWDANNGLVDLGTLGGKASQVYAMNDSGQVIGFSTDPNEKWHYFLWDSDTAMLDLSDPNRFPRPRGINNAGTVVGHIFDGRRCSASAWDTNRGLVPLHAPHGAHTVADRISNNGKIAGYSITKGNYCNLIIWDDPNNFRDLGRISKNLCPSISSINDAGQIVGLDYRKRMFSYRSSVFFFSDEKGIIDLGEFPLSGPTSSWWQPPWLSGSTSIRPLRRPDMNNRGQILHVMKAKDGKYHTFLMTPKKASKE